MLVRIHSHETLTCNEEIKEKKQIIAYHLNGLIKYKVGHLKKINLSLKEFYSNSFETSIKQKIILYIIETQLNLCKVSYL